MRKLARTVSVTAIAAALMAAPSGASGATTIGQTFTPPVAACGANITHLQTTSPGSSYAAPQNGVITTWTFQASSSPPQLKLKVGRAAGGNSYLIVGESALQTPGPNTLTTYPTRIPVQAGDVIGPYTQTSGGCSRFGASGYFFHFTNGDIGPGTTTTFNQGGANIQLDIAAGLEPDCDNDGFGDETQDQDLSSCAPGTIPPPAPGGPTCQGKPATIVGTNGNDVRTGSRGRDVIVGLGGNDSLSGVAGNDVICGGAGKDTLKGGKGKDTLLGQKGKDKLKGGGGKDFCKGGKGNDSASKCEVEKSI